MLCWLPRSPGERERDGTNGASADRDDPKVLISTTSHLVGEFEKSHILLSLAWPGIGGQAILRWSEGPLSRTALVIAFETDPISKLPGTLIPDHSPAGDLICSYLAVLFGKRFDNHGALENQGSFYIPDLTPFTETCNQRLPQNSHEPRTNFPVPLNLAEVSRIERQDRKSVVWGKWVDLGGRRIIKKNGLWGIGLVMLRNLVSISAMMCSLLNSHV